MGAAFTRAIHANPSLHVSAAAEHAAHPAQGCDIGAHHKVGVLGVKVSDALSLAGSDVVIDFSLPVGTQALLNTLNGVPLVIGTTGLSEKTTRAISEYALNCPVVQATNFATGVVLLNELARLSALVLEDYDLEIVERHHRNKLDAPSGTALSLAQALADARGWEASVYRHGREGSTGVRPTEQIGIHSVRAGDAVGDHIVELAGPGETVRLQHTATSREVFAFGALRAAQWVVNQPNGLYDMRDVLGLRVG
jgi:4-hydroxy-tetrahydrodipicolinate reductase